MKEEFVPYCDGATEEEKGVELPPKLPYLTTNLCWRKANIEKPNSCKIQESNFGDGPLVFLERAKWNKHKAVRSLLHKSENVSVFPFLKLRGVERQVAIEMISEGDYQQNSTLGKVREGMTILPPLNHHF